MLEMEMGAWSWLLSLPRLQSFRRQEKQVIIRFCPGELDNRLGGMPLVSVSVDFGLAKRVIGRGNTLFEAVGRLQAEAQRREIKDLPLITVNGQPVLA